MSWISCGMLFAELAVCLLTLVAFGSAYPDRYRTKLWENGGAEGWNSDPGQGLEVPLIWSQQLTNSNLAKAILSSTVFIVRAATSRFGNPFPRINALYSIILCLLWAACLRDQTSPDFSDAQHPSVRPWYLMKSCSEAQDDAQFACGAAQTSFHITVMTVLVYCLRTVLDLTETTAVWRARRVARERVEDRELRIATEQAFRASEGKGCSNRSGDYDDINSVYDYDPNHERQGTSEQRRQDCNTSEAASPVLAFYPADVRFVPC